MAWTFTALSLGIDPINAMAFGNSIFVAVGSGGIAYSTSRTSWTKATLPDILSGATWRSIAFGNGTFMAIADQRLVAYSTDGINWSSAGPLSGVDDSRYKAVVFGEGKFVVLGRNLGPLYFDGTGWKLAGTCDTSRNYSAGIYANGSFYFFAEGSTTGVRSITGHYPSALSPKNTLAWVDETVFADVSYAANIAVAFGNEQLVIASAGNDGATRRFTRKDMRTWRYELTSLSPYTWTPRFQINSLNSPASAAVPALATSGSSTVMLSNSSDTSLKLPGVELKAGNGLIIEKKSDTVTEIREVAQSAVPYQTDTFVNGPVTITITWKKNGFMVHAQISLTMTLDNAQNSQMSSKLLEAIRPGIDIKVGDSSMRTVVIQSDGTIKYASAEMGEMHASVAYFVGV
jgi:hypothetical protein